MDPITGVKLIEVGGAIYRSYAAPSSGQPARSSKPQQRQAAAPAKTAAAPAKTAPAAAESPAALGAVAPGSTGAFTDRKPLDAPILPFLVGRQGTRRREIERETGASLDIPRAPPASNNAAAGNTSKNAECVVTIRASTQAAVDAARARVAAAFDSAVNARRLDYDAFVALPLTGSNSVTAALSDWGARVRAHPDASKWGLTDESIFVDPPLLHLTIVMLKLYSAPRRAAAARTLEAAAAAARAVLSSGGPLRVRLRGLANMGSDDAAMHVAYAQVEEVGSSGRLEAVCAAAVKAFKDAGLLIQGERETVKIHATVINTRSRSSSTNHHHHHQQQQQQQQDNSSGGGGRGRQQQKGEQQRQEQQERVPFDGRDLLRGEVELDLGEVNISEVAVVRRGARGPDGFYERLSAQAL